MGHSRNSQTHSLAKIMIKMAVFPDSFCSWNSRNNFMGIPQEWEWYFRWFPSQISFLRIPKIPGIPGIPQESVEDSKALIITINNQDLTLACVSCYSQPHEDFLKESRSTLFSCTRQGIMKVIDVWCQVHLCARRNGATSAFSCQWRRTFFFWWKNLD